MEWEGLMFKPGDRVTTFDGSWSSSVTPNGEVVKCDGATTNGRPAIVIAVGVSGILVHPGWYRVSSCPPNPDTIIHVQGVGVVFTKEELLRSRCPTCGK